MSIGARGRFLRAALGCLALWGSALGAVWAGDPEQGNLERVRALIRQQGARWTADENEVSSQGRDSARALCGLLPGSSGTPTGGEGLLVLPASFDWRNVNGASYVTPVRAQSSCGSCWAFATTAVLESKTLLAAGQPGAENNLSEQTLVSCSGAGSCGGGYIDFAAAFLVSTGIPSEACFPYAAVNLPCSQACDDWEQQAYRAQGMTYVAATVEGIKQAVMTHGPVVSSMAVYDDFRYYSGGVYSRVSSLFLGYHAVTVVGWTDSEQAFVVKNSWGPSWGAAGYFLIAYSQVDDPNVSFGAQTVALTGTVSTDPLYSISGRVTVNGVGVPNLKMTAGSQAGYTSPDGTYTIAGLGKGSYTVTPTTLGYCFTPQTRTVTIGETSITGVDFTAVTCAGFSISGSANLNTGANPANIAVSADDGIHPTWTVHPDSTGHYQLTGLPNGRYTVRPCFGMFAFNGGGPAYQVVQVNGGDVTNINFMGMSNTTMELGGWVTFNGAALGQVDIRLGMGVPYGALTDSNGHYNICSLNGAGSYSFTVTPSRQGYVFTPPSITVLTSAGTQYNLNFTAQLKPSQIRGTVSLWNGQALAGATVTARDANQAVVAQATSGASGAFTLASGQLVDGTYTLTAAMTGYSMAPSPRTVIVSGADVLDQNFTATGLYGIAGRVLCGDLGVMDTKIAIGSDFVTTDYDGRFTFPNLGPGSYTLVPTKAHYRFTPASVTATLTDHLVTLDPINAERLYSISGAVTLAGAARPDVVVSCGSSSTATGSSGEYLLADLGAGTYTIVPTQAGLTFTPPSAGVTLSAATGDVSGVDFVAVPPPLTVAASGTPTSGTAPLTVVFSAAAAGGLGPYTYGWEFGDKQSGEGASPSHVYGAGSFVAVVTATDSLGTHASASVPVEVALGVSLSATPSGGVAPLPVQFTGSATGGVAPYTYRWNFGEGPVVGGGTMSYTFKTAGTFKVGLWITDSRGFEGSSSIQVRVVDPLSVDLYELQPPWFTCDPNVTLIARARGGGAPFVFTWTLPDGSVTTHTSESATDQLPVALQNGNNLFSVGVVDAVGQSVSASYTRPYQPVVASISAVPAAGVGPLTVTFSASVSGWSADSYTWNFGDGTTGSGATVTHTYTTPGNYTASVVAKIGLGCQVTAQTTVQVRLQVGLTAQPGLGRRVRLTSTVTGGTAPYTFTWNFGDSTPATTTTTAQTTYNYKSPGTYTAVVTVTDSRGVQGQASVTFTVQ